MLPGQRRRERRLFDFVGNNGNGTSSIRSSGHKETFRLRSRRIALLSLEEKIDTNSAGKLAFHVFGAIAYFERRLIAERTKDGIVPAPARGKRPATPRCR